MIIFTIPGILFLLQGDTMTWKEKHMLNELIHNEHKPHDPEIDQSELFYLNRMVQKARKNPFKEPGKDKPAIPDPAPQLQHKAGYNNSMYEIHQEMTRPAGRTVKGVSQRREYNYLYPR